MAITYNNLYLNIRTRLRQEGYPSASLEARELVCCGSGKTKEEFFRDAPLYVAPEVETAVYALVERHLHGEPVAYLIGEWEFYGVPLEVSDAVLIPRPDTEVLAELAIEYAASQGLCRVLDLCAGTGCIGLAIAVNAPESRILLGDISEGAVQICRKNIRRNHLAERVAVMTMDALRPPPRAVGEFQCIVCNPPYIPRAEVETLDSSVKDFEPHLALCGGEDGYDFYRAVVHHWKEVLVTGGRLYFEVGIHQAEEVLRLMRTEGFGDLEIVPDLQGIPRVVYGTRVDTI